MDWNPPISTHCIETLARRPAAHSQSGMAMALTGSDSRSLVILASSLLNSSRLSLSALDLPPSTLPPCNHLAVFSRRLADLMASSSSCPPPVPAYTCLDSQLELWYACAGELIQIPQVNSMVYYFPQGHSEHSYDPQRTLQLMSERNIPSTLFCSVESVNFLAEQNTDEVFTRIKLRRLFSDEQPPHVVDSGNSNQATTCVRKTYILFLSQKRELPIKEVIATMLFPDVSSGQLVHCTDVYGVIWKFRLNHQHRPGGLQGPPILTEGWDAFVSAKGLLAKDLIIFMRDRNGVLRICVRHWMKRKAGLGVNHVVNAAKSALEFKPFEALFYPRSGIPEFVIKVSDYEAGMSAPWREGSRFLIRYEEDECSREVSPYKQADYWQEGNACIGTVLSRGPFDQRWPHSPWRLLWVRVPKLERNAIQVSPWLVTFLDNPEKPQKQDDDSV